MLRLYFRPPRLVSYSSTAKRMDSLPLALVYQPLTSPHTVWNLTFSSIRPCFLNHQNIPDIPRVYIGRSTILISSRNLFSRIICPPPDLNRDALWARDFESRVSTTSTRRAIKRTWTGLEPASSTSVDVLPRPRFKAWPRPSARTLNYHVHTTTTPRTGTCWRRPCEHSVSGSH